MRINDLLNESERLDEKPMGFLSKIGNTVAAKLGSPKAAGRLGAGKEANWLKDQFIGYLGATGKSADPKTIIDFLKQNGYPTERAEQIMNRLLGSNQEPAATQPDSQDNTNSEPAAPKPTSGKPRIKLKSKVQMNDIHSTLEEQFSDKDIDEIFTAAVQDAIARDSSTNTRTASTPKQDQSTSDLESRIGNLEVAVDHLIQQSKTESVEKQFSEGQVYLFFKRLATVNQQQLAEGIVFENVFDAVRKQESIKLTRLISAEELVESWKSAGASLSVVDVVELAKAVGVNQTVIDQTLTDMMIQS